MSGINFEEEEEENGSRANLRSQFLGLGATLLIFNLIFNRDKMLNPTLFFFNVLWISGMQFQNLLFFLKPVLSLVPGMTELFTSRLSPHTPGEPALFSERIF